MSVINKMLRDLDKRQQGHQLSNVSSNHVQYTAHTTASPPWLLICGLALALFGAGVYAYHAMTQATALEKTADYSTASTGSSTASIDNSTAAVENSMNSSNAPQVVQAQTSGQAIEYAAEQADVVQQNTSQANAQVAQQATVPHQVTAANTDTLNTITYNAAQAPKVDDAGFAQPQLVTRSAVVKPPAVNSAEGIAAIDEPANDGVDGSDAEINDAEIDSTELESAEVESAKVGGAETRSAATTEIETRHIETADLATKHTATDFDDASLNTTAQGVVNKSQNTNMSTASSLTAEGKAPRTSSGEMAVTEVKLTNAQLAQKSLTLATEAEGQGRFTEAIHYFEKSLQFDPATHEARRKLAALHYGQGRYIKAANVLQEGILLFPQHDEFALLLARVQQAGGQADDALITLALIADTSVLARQKWLAQTDIAQQQGQYALAEEAYRQLLQQEPQQGKWWMGLAYALDSQQQFGKARQAYQTALSHRGLSTQATDFIEQRLTQLGDSQ